MISDVKDKPIVNPVMVLREEFDDWAVLFNPDNGDAFAMNPVSVFIWKLLNGKNSVESIVEQVKSNCEDVPTEVTEHVNKFIQELVEKGYVGYQVKN